jgi:hypothetical protein
VRLLDRLDAYLWAIHHAPHLAHTDDWRWSRREISEMSEEFRRDIREEVLRATLEVTRPPR